MARRDESFLSYEERVALLEAEVAELRAFKERAESIFDLIRQAAVIECELHQKEADRLRGQENASLSA